MGREVKRVPLDFDYPVGEIWAGYEIHFYDDVTTSNKNIFSRIMKCKYSDACDLLSVDPPKGDGYQMWETVSEGSPISPVFKTPEELAQWLADTNASSGGSQGATYEQWMSMIKMGWAPSMVITSEHGIMSGVEAAEKLKLKQKEN